MKKTIWIRVLHLLLTVVLLLGVASCSKPEDPQSTEDQETLESIPTGEIDPTETLPKVTYNGDVFTILLRNGEEHIGDLAVSKLDENSTSVDKAVFSRNNNVEDHFDIEFAYVTVAVSDFAGKVTKAISSDPELYDVIAGDGRTIFKGVTSGYYADWNELEYIDLNGEWWSQSARREWTTPGGRIFAMNGDLSYMSIGNNCAMFFNKTLLANAKITSPYDQVYANNWTLDVFIQTAKDIDGNMNHDDTNNLDTDSFGYATQWWRGPIYATFCNGIGSLVKNQDGDYEIGLKNENVGNTVEKYIDLVKNSGVAHYGSNLSKVRNAFLSERVAFTDDNVKCAVYFKGTGVDFGIVPYPKANKDIEYASLVGSGTNTFAVVRTMSAAKLSRASAILEGMACYGNRDVIPYYYGTILSYQAMQDEHSLKMLEIIRQAGFFDLGHYTNYGSIADVTKLMIDNPSTYGTSIYTAIEVLEAKTMAELEVWFLLDELK